MNLGKRIIYNQDGEILLEMGEIKGAAYPHSNVDVIHVLDLDYGSIDYNKYRILKIDMETNKPVLEEIPLAPEQQKIKDLEDMLLLSEDANVGGIL
jgi:hypothetical protein